jgi:hypothetical protein
MSRQLLAFATAAVLAGIASGGVASSAPMTGFAGVASADAALSPIEKTQYVWGGYDYCWYDDGVRYGHRSLLDLGNARDQIVALQTNFRRLSKTPTRSDWNNPFQSDVNAATKGGSG